MTAAIDQHRGTRRGTWRGEPILTSGPLDTTRVLPDLTDLYPEGWTDRWWIKGDPADGSAHASATTAEAARRLARVAAKRTGTRMRVFLHTDSGEWSYKPAAVHHAVTTAPAPTPPDPRDPALEPLAATYGAVATAWCDHAPGHPRAPISHTAPADRTCGWDYNGNTWSPAALDHAHHAAREHAHTTRHRVQVTETIRVTYTPGGAW